MVPDLGRRLRTSAEIAQTLTLTVTYADRTQTTRSPSTAATTNSAAWRQLSTKPRPGTVPAPPGPHRRLFEPGRTDGCCHRSHVVRVGERLSAGQKAVTARTGVGVGQPQNHRIITVILCGC
ncbi:hypothetical protein [Streptomyces globisporus]|uniref:hypothetical protein n=1 Tax=Streptomyces globisporus TaxID=1908 RepID=UPI002F916B0C